MSLWLKTVNSISIRRCFSSSVSSNWNTINIHKTNENQYQVAVDEKVLQSVKKSPLNFPNEHIAIMFAQEWATSGRNPKKLVNSPISKLTQRANLFDHDREERIQAIESIKKFISTDTILFWNEHEPELFSLQLENWNPIIQFINRNLQTSIKHTVSLLSLLIEKDLERVGIVVSELDNWKLAAFELSSKLTTSVLISIYLLIYSQMTPIHALSCSRLEENYQFKKWGNPSFNSWQIQQTDMNRLMTLSNCIFKLTK